MKIGTSVTVLTPLMNKRIQAQKGVYIGCQSKCKVVRLSDKTDVHVPKNSKIRITKRMYDISPCGLVE